MTAKGAFRVAPRSLYICNNCRHHLRTKATPSLPPSGPLNQKRCITKSYIRSIQEADAEWKMRAAHIEAGRMKSMLSILEERGLINQIVGSRNDLEHLLTHRRVGIYAGIDPTAPSIHVGHMIPFMALGWLFIHGYKTTFVLGGFTAAIGDPIGRLKGREAMSPTKRKANMTAMHFQLKRLGASIESYADRKGYKREWAWRRALENNTIWWGKLTARDFLSILGRNIRIGPMLGRDTVKNRLESGDGMSFAEFSYPLVQAWDWWHLFQKGTQIQIGGADQFGNILAGAEAVKQIAKESHEFQQAQRQAEMIDKQHGIRVTNDPMGFTVPLLTTASGEKFGKSAGNAVWLDPEMTSTFELYQFFLRSADADVEKYLKLFTFLSLSEISEIMQEHEKDQSRRVAQHKLAREFVELIYGLGAAQEAEAKHRKLFNKNPTISEMTTRASGPSSTEQAQTGTPRFSHPSLNKHAQPLRREDNDPINVKLPASVVFTRRLESILWAAGVVKSRAEGKRLVHAGGMYIGGRADARNPMDDALSFTPAKTGDWEEVEKFIIDKSLLIVRSGKWRVKMINIMPDTEYASLGLTNPAWEEMKEKEQAVASDKAVGPGAGG